MAALVGISVGVSQLIPEIFPPAKPAHTSVVFILDVSPAMQKTRLDAAEGGILQSLSLFKGASTSLRLIKGCATSTDPTVPFATNHARQFSKVFADLAVNEQFASSYSSALGSALDDLGRTGSQQKLLIIFTATPLGACPPSLTALPSARGLALTLFWLGSSSGLVDTVRRQLGTLGFSLVRYPGAQSKKKVSALVVRSMSVAASSTNPTSTPTSNPVSQPPSYSAPPSISGTPEEDQTLSASPGSWSDGPTFSYQWQDCDATGSTCTDIAGATSSAYTVQSGDVGYTLQVAVTASNSGGSSTPVSSAVTSVVTSAPTPQPTTQPQTTG